MRLLGVRVEDDVAHGAPERRPRSRTTAERAPWRRVGRCNRHSAGAPARQPPRSPGLPAGLPALMLQPGRRDRQPRFTAPRCEGVSRRMSLVNGSWRPATPGAGRSERCGAPALPSYNAREEIAVTLMRFAPISVAALLVALTPLPGETRQAAPATAAACSLTWVGHESDFESFLTAGKVAEDGSRADRRHQAAARLPRARAGRPLRLEGAAAPAVGPASTKATRRRSPPISSIACSTCTWSRRSWSARSTARSAPRSTGSRTSRAGT